MFPQAIAAKLPGEPSKYKWKGHTSTDGLSEIGNMLKQNGHQVTAEEIDSMRAWANQQWCERDPKRCKVTQGAMRMVKTLAGAIAGEAGAIIQKRQAVTKSMLATRLAVCSDCEFYLKRLKRCSA